jgi:hypothetical protein
MMLLFNAKLAAIALWIMVVVASLGIARPNPWVMVGAFLLMIFCDFAHMALAIAEKRATD